MHEWGPRTSLRGAIGRVHGRHLPDKRPGVYRRSSSSERIILDMDLCPLAVGEMLRLMLEGGDGPDDSGIKLATT
jgi:hypothetical protein